ncbi:RNA-binding protein 38 isoform X2 [Cinnamomum micranthum f. kanehirae]|uniref:RNA-binding protein 38 isoform X2 n=1 Tax=Cinnamomum micranthum f. kanehirae TaxID=337451 RepID=A0A3S3N980_9MAGN|nr:RNA-binding protein 38 isoform X2 [Cinnamomum micranthum f. kanehirae]
MSGSKNNEPQQQLGDSTYNKVFVGGLAWETHRETLNRHFEQFGEILEAVVIADKYTGRSKGYGFVTFKDPESATKACEDPSPVIDGRKANCNLASLGQRSHQYTHRQGIGRFRPVLGSSTPVYRGTFRTYLQQPAQYPLPYSTYGYSRYSQANMYPANHYSVYRGHQSSPYYAVSGPGMLQNFYLYYTQFGHGNGSIQAQAFCVQYPPVMQYSCLPQQYHTGILSLPASATGVSGLARSDSMQSRTVTTTTEQNSTA